jgi:hypothetical protein
MVVFHIIEEFRVFLFGECIQSSMEEEIKYFSLIFWAQRPIHYKRHHNCFVAKDFEKRNKPFVPQPP